MFRRRPVEAGPDGAGHSHRVLAQDGGVIITSAAELENFLRGLGGSSGAGVTVTDDKAMRVAACYRCVTLISGAVATMPLAIKRRVDERTRADATDHWLWALLNRKPNPWQTPSQFRRQLQAQLLHRGHGFARKVRGARGDVIALIPLHPDRIATVQADDFTLRFTYTTPQGGQQVIAQRDMFYLTGMSLDGINGLGVIRYAREALGLAIAEEQHGGALFKNGTALGGVLQHPKTLSDKGVDNLIESLEKFRGSENASKTLLLEEGMEYKPLGMSSQDAQFLESRGFQRSEIFMFFGVPPHMAGDTTKTTSWGSGIEQQSLGFVTYTLEDWLTTWEQSIARDLIPEAESDIYARFNRAALVRGDIKTRYSAYATARQWALATINEIRSLEDQNPIEGGDDPFAVGNGNQAATGGDPNDPTSGAPGNGDGNED